MVKCGKLHINLLLELPVGMILEFLVNQFHKYLATLIFINFRPG